MSGTELPMEFLVRGLAIGFVIAAGIGPIGLLCIRRTLDSGFRVGLASGLGAAVADSVYAALATFGAGGVAMALVGARAPLALGGGICLVALGIGSWRHARDRAIAANDRGRRLHLLGAWASTLGLTLSNPMTVLSFAAAIAALAPPAGNLGAAAAIVAGVGFGSTAWWVVLSAGVAIVRRGISEAGIVLLRQASAVLLMAFGAAAIGSGLMG
jgi:putative LysE/RhtB family amino acid efflux pump